MPSTRESSAKSWLDLQVHLKVGDVDMADDTGMKGSNVYSPEHAAASADGSTVYATNLAGNRVLVLTVTPPR